MQEQTRTDRCEVCQRCVLITGTCDQPKNGYCALFRLQAAKDAKIYNIHPSIHTKAKKESP